MARLAIARTEKNLPQTHKVAEKKDKAIGLTLIG
jgi:hypothetical protein